MDEAAIKNVVLSAFEYSYQHDDWVYPLADALDGVTADEAAWRPGPEVKGIWDIVLHMTVWTENIIERMRTAELVYPPGRMPWPAPPSLPNEQAWEASKARLWNALGDLRAYIEANPLDALNGPPYGLGDLLCRFIHNGYHIGQITKLREVKGTTATNADPS